MHKEEGGIFFFNQINTRKGHMKTQNPNNDRLCGSRLASVLLDREGCLALVSNVRFKRIRFVNALKYLAPLCLLRLPWSQNDWDGMCRSGRSVVLSMQVCMCQKLIEATVAL